MFSVWGKTGKGLAKFFKETSVRWTNKSNEYVFVFSVLDSSNAVTLLVSHDSLHRLPHILEICNNSGTHIQYFTIGQKTWLIWADGATIDGVSHHVASNAKNMIQQNNISQDVCWTKNWDFSWGNLWPVCLPAILATRQLIVLLIVEERLVDEWLGVDQSPRIWANLQ